MLLNDKWVFARELAKVFEKPGNQWIQICEKLVEYNFNTIPWSKYRDLFDDSLENFAQAVVEKLEIYSEFEATMEEGFELKLEELRVLVYATVTAKLQQYKQKDVLNRISRMARPMMKKKSLKDKLRTKSENSYTVYHFSQYKEAFISIYGQESYNLTFPEQKPSTLFQYELLGDMFGNSLLLDDTVVEVKNGGIKLGEIPNFGGLRNPSESDSDSDSDSGSDEEDERSAGQKELIANLIQKPTELPVEEPAGQEEPITNSTQKPTQLPVIGLTEPESRRNLSGSSNDSLFDNPEPSFVSI